MGEFCARYVETDTLQDTQNTDKENQAFAKT